MPHKISQPKQKYEKKFFEISLKTIKNNNKNKETFIYALKLTSLFKKS